MGLGRVIVVGAGVAGLAAANKLADAGLGVTVLEAQPRVGGRALTIRSGFPAGLVAEAGPARILGAFERVRRYAHRLALDLVPFYPESGKVISLRDGKRQTVNQLIAENFWGYEAKASPWRAIARGALGRPDGRTMAFAGGIDRLTEGLVTITHMQLRLRTTVVRLRQMPRSVQVTLVGERGAETLEAEHVVCAVPLSIVPALTFEPALAGARLATARAVPFSSAIRVFVQMTSAYWREAGYNGFAITDTLGEVWDPQFAAAPSPAMLVCYATGPLADRITALAPEERLRYATRELESVFPGSAVHFERGTSFSWREQPWVRGGWPLVRNGFENAVHIFQRPEGRIHFAGDYAATPAWLNTLEGAIESGERAAADVLHA